MSSNQGISNSVMLYLLDERVYIYNNPYGEYNAEKFVIYIKYEGATWWFQSEFSYTGGGVYLSVCVNV